MKRLLALLLVVILLVGCQPQPQTQTIVQIVVTATPNTPLVENTAVPQGQQIVSCEPENVLNYLEPIPGWSDTAGKEMGYAADAADSGDMDDVNYHAANAHNVYEKMLKWITTEPLPECYTEFNEATRMGLEYSMLGIEEIADGDIDQGIEDLNKGTDYITKATQIMEMMDQPNG